MTQTPNVINLFDPGSLGRNSEVEEAGRKCSCLIHYPCQCTDQDAEGKSASNPELSRPNVKESNDDSDDDGKSSTWGNIPSVLLERIYHSMTYCERLRVSSVSKHWRSLLYSPRLWYNVDLHVNTYREGKKAYFLTKCIRFAQNVRVYWPATITQGTVAKARAMDLHNKETLKAFFDAMKQCENLRKLILKLENPCAFSKDFSDHTQDCLRVICKRNTNLTELSFGSNNTIIPAIVLDLLATDNIRELHITQTNVLFIGQRHDLSVNRLNAFSNMQNLQALSIDWCDISTDVIRGLSNRTFKLKKLNIIVSRHDCETSDHPTLDDWVIFNNKHPKIRISLTFVRHFNGACSSLYLIQPAVFLVKVLECVHIEPKECVNFFRAQRGTLQALVFCGVWNSIELEVGPALWPEVAACSKLKHLSFIGHYLLDEMIIFLTSHFVLDTLVVSKPHVMMFAEASPYLLPTSAGKYNQFKQEVSAILQKPWEAQNSVKLEGFYYAEGKDDKVFIPE